MSVPSPPVLRVALALPLPRLFDYYPSPELSEPRALVGCRVRVPFGKGEKIGLVLDIAEVPQNQSGTKAILECLDRTPLLSGELLQSLRWLSHYTQAPIGEVIHTALPGLLRQGAALPDTAPMAWQLSELGKAQLPSLRKGSRVRALGEALNEQPLAEEDIFSLFVNARDALNALKKRGMLERAFSSTHSDQPTARSAGPVLNSAQVDVLKLLLPVQARFQASLLEGITGSGKTEIYLHAIQDVLQQGKQALVLVPEIGLTPQTLARFRSRLGVPIHALHSGLNDTQRAHAWMAMARGDAQVLVGTRSAVFTPMCKPGLIIIDEEHDNSYKQQDGIRYHARDFAVMRAKHLNIPVLLGSATPSLESLHNAISSRYQHLHLKQRAGSAKPPRVRVIDIRKRTLEHGVSNDMLSALRDCLTRGEQALVFKNRRGYAPVLLCHDCGWSAQCPRCDSPMTVQGAAKNLQCHHCGHRKQKPNACPDCGSMALQPQGIGTERLEEFLAQQFPNTPLIRVDSQSTRNKDGLQKKLAELGEHAGILVGTQILAKGHDLPRLTLVCVVGIDEGLFSADFRASEKLSQLLIQVTGRAGRAQWAGEVLLQTHHPEHPMLNTLLAGGYPAVAAMELAQREAAGFPPYAHLALLRAEALKDADVNLFLREAHQAFRRQDQDQDQIELSSPMPAPMPRRAGKIRGQILISAKQRPALQKVLQVWVEKLYELKSARKVRWSIDVDPVDLY
jgi:primosomal protein N' (replication factor Y) (superfamily II helicase)